MTDQERIECIQTARRLIEQAAIGASNPMIETILGDADQCLHWALWNLGSDVEFIPELAPARLAEGAV
ncbi:MAG: hypothetical protein NXI21_17555 [Alphaproteobacteria bacterium]|nr:hypothetical protein [Alphaproteobacteria bacterium]